MHEEARLKIENVLKYAARSSHKRLETSSHLLQIPNWLNGNKIINFTFKLEHFSSKKDASKKHVTGFLFYLNSNKI